MKKRTFFVGLLSGLVLSQTWRPLTKQGIKLGIRAGSKAREFSLNAYQNLQEVAEQAREELEDEAAESAYRRDQGEAYEQGQEIN